MIGNLNIAFQILCMIMAIVDGSDIENVLDKELIHKWHIKTVRA